MKKIFLLAVSFGVLFVTVFFIMQAVSEKESWAKDEGKLSLPQAELKANQPVSDSKEVKQIRELHIKGDIDATIREAGAYLKIQPTNVEMLIRLAECYTSKREFSLAQEYAEKALDLSKEKDIWALRATAEIYRRQFEESKDANSKKKYIDLAMSTIAKALVISPNDAWVNAGAAQIYFSGNLKAKAMEAIEFALAADPGNTSFLDLKKKIQSMK